MTPSSSVAVNFPGWPPEIEKGSALDFSGLLDGPAGKYGRLIVAGGRFAFEKRPDQPVRFYGVNLSSSANFLDKKSCERLADRLAASGYNSLRIHHHDRTLTASTGERAVEIDPVEMDKLDYLFHCCKERGIYITTDLYVSRMTREVFAGLGRAVEHWEEFKFLIHLLADARKNWEDFSRNFLEHINPYTGLAWKDDPALVTLSMVNEDSIYHCYKNGKPAIRAVYDRYFQEWLTERNLTPENEERKTALLNLFLYETGRNSFAQMKAFVRSLGCQTLLTDQNHWSIIPMSLLRQPCDFVDDHFYWDHPENYQVPSKLLNTSSLSDLPAIFSGIFPGRCFGKPYTISEFNWVFPNQYRAESAPLTAAYAALQDWDGLYRYSYAHSPAAVNSTHPANFFDISADPINSLSDRIGLLLFLRGDVKSSRLQIPFAVSSGHMLESTPVNTYPGQAWKLGFVGQIGTVVEKEGRLELPANAKACIGVGDEIELLEAGSNVPLLCNQTDVQRQIELQKLCDFEKGALDWDGGKIRSSTGELELQAKAGTFRVVTPRSEVLSIQDGGELEGNVLTIRNTAGPAVVSASALDSKPLQDAQRILVIHLTSAIHEDTKFAENIVEQWGTSSRFIVREGQVRLTFHFTGTGNSPRVWALDFSGKRIREIPLTESGPTLSFTAETLVDKTPCFLYEILR